MLRLALVAPLAVAVLSGCNSPYRADRGALFGGLTGAGVGALVGSAVGHTGAGAALGAGVGAVTGAAIGDSLDEIEARNRAEIAAAMGQPVRAGAVTIDDAITMTRNGVSERLIVTHIQHHGVAQQLTANDLIFLKQQGVPDGVIQAMQTPPPPPVRTAIAPAPVIVEEHYYAPPPYYYHPRPYYWHHHHHHRHHRHHGPRTSIGLSFSR